LGWVPSKIFDARRLLHRRRGDTPRHQHWTPIEQLQKLAQLRDQGVVTAGEFEAKKADLLSRM
jgi:hypothetical protein